MSRRLALLWLALASAAQADPQAAAPFVAQGYDLFQSKAYLPAVEAFRRAYAADPNPKHLLNIAVSYGRARGHCSDALGAFERFFEICSDCALRPAAVQDHQRHLTACQAALRIDSTPVGAKVSVDGLPKGTTPVSLALPAGRHAVRLEATDHSPLTHPVELDWQADTRLSLTLSPSPDRQGTLRLVDRPIGTTVRLNGDPVQGDAPLRLAPGARTLELTTEAGLTRQLAVVIPPGGEAVVDLGARLIPPPKDFRPHAWTSLAVAGAGLVVGGLAHAAYADAMAAERRAVGRSAVMAARDDATGRATLAQVGYGVALTGLIGGALFWLGSDPPQPAP